MGTEQYPKENEYSEFLAKNNGSSNAYTATSNTNYHFSVATPALAPALSRFAAFFHSPLFSPSCTSRELNAVDSEHKKNFQNDMWRIFQLNKHLSKDGHVWNKFGSGNRESLSKAGKDLKAKGKLNGITNGVKKLDSSALSANTSLSPTPIPSRIASPAPSVASNSSESDPDGGTVGRETRRRLVEWWSREYCASRMKLCVIGKEPLDELADLVSNLFTPIQNRGQDPLPMINDHPFGPNETSRLVSVQTIMSFHALEISFPLDYQPPHWRYKPGNFLAHFVGHEGPGSLHSYLKSKGWITSLTAGPQSLARGFAMLKVTTHLTQEGFKNHRSVMLAVFKIISLLRSSEFPVWYQREMSLISQTRFRFKEKNKPESYAIWISTHMTWPVPPELVLSAPQLVWEWDESDSDEGGLKEIRKILETLTVDKGRAVLMAKAEEHKKISATDAVWETEPVYGTQYKVEKLEKDFVEQLQGPNDIPQLRLPGPNDFIPTNLDVDKREVAEPIARPHLIKKTKLSVLWHKKDDQFWVPKAHVIIEIRTPFANRSPKESVLTRLFTDLVTDSLTEFSYDAELAGLEYSFASHTQGLWVTLSGYNDKLPVLAHHVLERIKDIKVDPERLRVIKEHVERDWKNFFLGQTYRISDYFGRYLVTDNLWTLEEKLPEVPGVDVKDVQDHIDELFSMFNMRILVNGNLHESEAISIMEKAEEILTSSQNPIGQSRTPQNVAHLPQDEVIERALILPESSNNIWTTSVPNANEPNSSLTYYMHVGNRTSSTLRVTASLLTQILSEPAFNVLRTKEQLGYIVLCSTWVLAGSGCAGIRIVIQSEKGPAYLESRVDAFLDGMKTVLEEMKDEEFEEQKNGLNKKLTEKAKTVGEETNIFWSHIDSGYLDFFRRARDAESLKSVTKDDVLKLFLSKVHPSSPTRSKLAVHCRSQVPRPKPVSTAAAQAFEGLVRSAGIAVDEGGWQEELGSDPAPTITDFQKYWQGTLVGPGVNLEVAQQLLGQIPSLVEKYPTEGEDEDGAVKREGVNYIEDVKAFKAGLALSDPPKPLVPWDELLTSKY
jgi:insulysin